MRRLLLIGAGHVHTGVLRHLAATEHPDADVVLVDASDRMIYTGMLPGWIAGHYALADITVPLEPLARAASAQLVHRRIVGLDLERRQALTAYGERIDFDVVSIATGAALGFDAIAGSRDHALPNRPLPNFVEGWQRIVRHALTSEAPLRLTVVGAGAAGVETALAMQYRLQAARDDVHVQLVTGDAQMLPGYGAVARRLLRNALLRTGVRLIEGMVQQLEPEAAVLEGGLALPTTAALLFTGAAAEQWPREAGLATDAQGFIAVNRCLQSTSHPFVFAAGDVAVRVDAPRPKSGVYALRAAPALAANLLAFLAGEELRPHRPPRRALYLVSTGPRHAVASWGPVAFEGDWVWRWKDRIDRAYIAQLRPREEH
jgi:pyridine nucleotide-disulfide oxidoreductase family protein